MGSRKLARGLPKESAPSADNAAPDFQETVSLRERMALYKAAVSERESTNAFAHVRHQWFFIFPGLCLLCIVTHPSLFSYTADWWTILVIEMWNLNYQIYLANVLIHLSLSLLNEIFHAIYLWSFWQFPLIHWKDCSFYSTGALIAFIRTMGLRQISNTVILSAHDKPQWFLHY